MQPAEQGAEVAGRLPRIGVRQQDHRLVQGKDQGQERRGHAPVQRGRHAALAVTGVVSHERAERLGRTPAAVFVNGLIDGDLAGLAG